MYVVTQVVVVAGEKHSEIGSRCHYTMPGVNSVNPVEMFRILRICYMFPPSAVIVDAATDTELQQPTVNGEPATAAGVTCTRRSTLPLSYETFTPELVRDLEQLTESPPDSDPASVPTRVVERMEMMKETFSKVIAFLRNSGKYYRCAFPLTIACFIYLFHQLLCIGFMYNK